MLFFFYISVSLIKKFLYAIDAMGGGDTFKINSEMPLEDQPLDMKCEILSHWHEWLLL